MKFILVLLLCSCAPLRQSPEQANAKLIKTAQQEYKKIHGDLNRKNANALILDPISELEEQITKSRNPYVTKLLRRAQDLTEVLCGKEIKTYEACQDAKPISLSLREIQIRKQTKFTKDICSSGIEYKVLCARHQKLLQHLKSSKYTFTKTPWYNSAVLDVVP